MDSFDQKTFQTSRGYTYAYYVSQVTSDAATSSLPTLLFHHGWPDSAHMWSAVVASLMSRGVRNRVLVPDMLGYGGTSKPTDPAAYRTDGITQDMAELVASESIKSVVSIGHDWGVSAAMRLYSFHPEIVTSLILMNVHYRPPSRQPFNLDETNAAVTHAFGRPLFAYWKLFAAPEGPKILKDNVGRLYTVLHAAGADSMRKFFCEYDAIKSYLLADSPEVEVRSYAQDPKMKADFVERMTRDGFGGPQCWYVATTEGHQYDSERDLPEHRDRVNVPLLYIGATQDAVCVPEQGKLAKVKGLMPDLQECMVEAAHWSPFEKPEAVAEFMAAWLVKRGFTGKT